VAEDHTMSGKSIAQHAALEDPKESEIIVGKIKKLTK